jgi:hypothetical protein
MRHRINDEIGKNLPKRSGIAVDRKIWLASDIERDIAFLKFPLKMRQNLFNQFTGVEAAPMTQTLIRGHFFERLNKFGGAVEI